MFFGERHTNKPVAIPIAEGTYSLAPLPDESVPAIPVPLVIQRQPQDTYVPTAGGSRIAFWIGITGLVALLLIGGGIGWSVVSEQKQRERETVAKAEQERRVKEAERKRIEQEVVKKREEQERIEQARIEQENTKKREEQEAIARTERERRKQEATAKAEREKQEAAAKAEREKQEDAARAEQAKISEFLAKHKIAAGDVNSVNATNLLYNAVGTGDVTIVKYLVSKGANVNMKIGKEKDTPLHRASQRGHVDIVKFLVSQGANVNARTLYSITGWTKSGKRKTRYVDHYTPLHMAAMGNYAGVHSGNLEVIKFLVSAGADVKAKTNGGDSPADLAAVRGDIEMTKYLVSQGATSNPRRDSDALEYAEWKKNSQAMRSGAAIGATYSQLESAFGKPIFASTTESAGGTSGSATFKDGNVTKIFQFENGRVVSVTAMP